MSIFTTIYIFSFLGFIIHYMMTKPKETGKVFELFLLYQLVFNIGLLGLLSFIGLTFLPDIAAAHVGWTPCHFEQELANVNLGYGVLGLLCIWLRGDFWTAVVIGASIWLFGDGLDHFFNAFYHHNLAPGNLGVLFYTDILIPIVMIVSLILYLYYNDVKTERRC